LHGSKFSKDFKKIKKGVEFLRDYFKGYEDSKIESDKYMQLRKSKIQDEEKDELSKTCEGFKKEYSIEMCNNLGNRITSIEKAALWEIIEANFVINESLDLPDAEGGIGKPL
jgi:hypothetical protein